MNFENLKLKTIECAVRFKPKSDGWVAKNRKYHIIGVELGGDSLHDFGSKKFTLKENSLFFFNQKDDFSVTINEKGESLSVHFTTYEDIETDSFCIQDGTTPEIIALLERIITESITIGGNELKLTELFYRLCNATEKIRKRTYSKKDIRLISAKEYIDRNYTKDGCLDDATKLTSLTRRRFNDLFKSTFGITPNRYLVRLRTEYAKQLLSATDLSVSDISVICGFSDIYYFSKTFKTETGLTPSHYRRQI